MRRNILNKLFLISCLLIVVSCKAKKQLAAGAMPPVASASSPAVPAAPVASPPPVNNANLTARLGAINASQFSFNTFSGRANAKLDIDGSKNDAVLNIHINHDKEIWVSVSVTVLVTVEVARAVITPDSIMVINKLQGVYLKKPFSYIYQYANNQVNYNMLESLLVGNAIPEILRDNNAGLQTDNVTTTLSGTLGDLVYQLMLGADMKVGQFDLSNHNAGQSLQVNNSMFMPVASKIMPSQIDIQSTSQNKKILVNLHYSRVEVDKPLQYPFNIPGSYKPADGN